MRKELITHFMPKDPVSEMFRNLRTNIQFMNTNVKSLLITSTMPGEGKSYVSSNLAVTFAQAGKSVILIDSDMRKGRLHTIFDVMPRPGLSNYLSGVVPMDFTGDRNNINDFIQETQIENLYMIAAGNIPPNPSELLISSKMNRLIKELARMFDIIIFDGTPSLIVADAVIIARQVDSTIIISSHNETKKDNIQKVKTAIEQVGGKVAGVVLNKVPINGKKYENSYYYGGNSKKKKNKDENNVVKEILSKNNEIADDVPKALKKDYNKQSSLEKESTITNNGEYDDSETKKLLDQINSYLDEAKQDLNKKKK